VYQEARGRETREAVVEALRKTKPQRAATSRDEGWLRSQRAAIASERYS
jgi:hypothetical protein